MEHEDSLIMRDENFSTILEKESDEVIKSSVEDLVPILSEFEDTSDNDNDCDLPFFDNSVTFSNPLFDFNDDFTFNDDYAISLDLHSLSDVNPLCNESCVLVRPIEHIVSYVSNLIDKIDASLDMDVSTDIEDGYYDSEGDIIYLESLLIKDTIPNLPPGVFFRIESHRSCDVVGK
ncbi:hypothetical protein Tco_0754975 [Tanacetum coccineum]